MEFTAGAKNSPVVIALPMPDGSWETFRVVESPVMMPGLAARYPSIKSFKGYGLSSKGASARFDLSPKGFHAIMKTPKGEVYIDPYASEQTSYYLSYFTRDVLIDEDMLPALRCGYDPGDHGHSPIEGLDLDEETEYFHLEKNDDQLSIRTYRLALACTGEYGATHGGTVEAALASMNTAVNRLNQIFEAETAVRMVLIENNDELVFTDGATDPFDNANMGGSLLNQIQGYLNQNIGVNNYDLGHIFTNACSDVGGVAGGTICGQNKGRGVTCHYLSSVTAIVNRVMSHEIGHQFSAGHTWNNCPPTLEDNPGQFHSNSAMEPGSGSTIMSYAGSCGDQNIVNNNDLYYNIASLEEFIGFSRVGNGSTCGELVFTDNHFPELSLDYQNGFHIPIGTPFQLTAHATDVDDDALTYCWEQHDTGPISDLGNPFGTAPIFRSLPPTSNPTRVFPSLTTIINNQTDVKEFLPTYTRDLNFTCTVRDNNPMASANVWKEVKFKATETAGPFLVTHPNVDSIKWEAGSYTEVTWDVANTTNSLVNCQVVNIKLSTDGGFTYPYTLIENTPNDGSEFVTVPNITSTKARIRVEAADNIFFDISNSDFEILPPSQPGYSLTVTPGFQQICLPGTVEVQILTDSLLGFNNPVSLEILQGLPAGAEAVFSSNPVTPSENSALTIDFSQVNESGVFEVLLQAIAEDADTSYRTLYFSLIANDFSDLQLVGPTDGQEGIILSAEFNWTEAANALSYDFQLAGSPTFEDVLNSATGLTATTYTPSILFEENSLFFWRVRPSNICGSGEWLAPFAFQTVSVECAPYESGDTPVNISGTGLPTVNSTIFVPFEGTISDVNIPFLRANYQPVKSLRVTLISPAGTEVILFDQNCGNTINLVLGFDDEAPSNIICPPDDGIVFKPVQPLSAFQGENTFGNWTMRVRVMTGGFGASGALEDWRLEFCASLTPSAPYVITNDTLFVPPGQGNIITKDILEVQDEDNTPEELTYVIVTPPAHGSLIFLGETLSTGDTFRQATVNGYNLAYVHDGSDTQFDSFTFVVQDGEGGLIPTQKFNIKIDENAVVGTSESKVSNDMQIFPNPANGLLHIGFRQPLLQRAQLSLFNMHGREVMNRVYDNIDGNVQLDVSDLAGGMYILVVRTADQIFTGKLTKL